MLVSVREDIYNIKTKRTEEVDTMKLKCNFCVKENGNAVSTDKLYLKHFRGRDWLVCAMHAALKIFRKGRTNEETRRA
jgi:hypothetical protein